MTRKKRSAGLLLAPVLALSLFSGAEAVLLDVGPIVPQVINSSPPQHGFPLWYRDTNRVPLELCLSRTASVNGPMCLTQEPFPAQPFNFPNNFGPEAFWWSADAIMAMPGGGDARLIMALEAAFAVGDPIPGDQVSFARIRIRIDTPVAGTYVVTYPYGEMTFNVTDPDAGINYTRDIGIAVNNFNGALLGDVGPFLYWDTGPVAVGDELFVGDPNVDHRVLGSPFPDPLNPNQFSNFFRVRGPAAVGTLQTDLFAVMGKIYQTPIPTPLTVDRLTYSRDAAGMQFHAAATTQPVSNQVNPALPFPQNFALTGVPSALEVTGTGLPTQTMITNNPADGKFFAASSFFADPGTLPATVQVANINDEPDTVVTVPLVDDVTVFRATYRPQSGTLSIAADSADDVANPVLQAYMPGMAAPLGTLVNGQMSVSFPLVDTSVTPTKTHNIPPVWVTVKSAAGGEASALVTVRDISPPVVAGFSPASGVVGTAITLFGSNFSPFLAENIVTFNGTPATVLSATDSFLTVEVPLQATTGTISVTTSGGQAASVASFIPRYTTSVTLAGTGSGSVNSVPVGIACTVGTCSGEFDYNTALELIQSASGGSQFDGWSGDCTGTGPCTLSTTADWAVTAAFSIQPNIRIGALAYFGTAQAAFDAVQNGEVILARAMILPGSDPVYDRPGVSSTFSGGYADFTEPLTQSDYTTIVGSLTINRGELVIDQVIVN